MADLTIPSGVKNISQYAFYGCSGLASATLGGDLESIGTSAFYGCSGMQRVSIGNKVNSIGSSAFYNCNGLTGVYITDVAAWCKIAFNGTYANPLFYAHRLYVNGSLVTDLTIPSDVKDIGQYAFYGCSELTGVSMSPGIESIGTSAFYGCSGLTDVSIPNGVTSVGASAFASCSGLRSINIPESVSSIPSSVFNGCDRLWTSWYRTLANSSGEIGGGTSGGEGAIPVDPRYALAASPADRAIASVTVDGDCAIDQFVLTDGKVYDTVLRIINVSGSPAQLTLPSGYAYERLKGTTPLTIPASSTNLLTITRTADRVFFVSREQMESAQ